VKLDELGGAGGVCCDEMAAGHEASIAASTIEARIEWDEAMSQDNTLVSANSRAEERPAYDAARRASAFFDRADRGFIVVSGADRATYLQGLLTNDIVALKSGTGCYAAYLTPQGRMIADLWVYELGDVTLLALLRDVKDTVLAKLDQFIFSEDVQLGDVSATFASVAVVGPDAAATTARVITSISPAVLASLAEHGNLRTEFAGHPAILVRVTDTGQPGFDLYVESSQADQLKAALRAAGAQEVDPSMADVLRIEGGIPKFHLDMDEETIPLEAGIEGRAISLTKGCYVGQEVIIRVLHRGHGRVARKLVGLAFESDSGPVSGASVTAALRDIGRITSSVFSPALGRPIALAYVQREFVAAGTPVVAGGANGIVTTLPFVRPAGELGIRN
jgi:folate-binding protein YgfZ